jgi:dTDP-4-amino-4,6-dideoxygalactose transaminase
VHEGYLQRLVGLFESRRLAAPHVPEHCDSNYHMFYVLAADGATRDALLTHLRGDGIQAVIHYVPLHSAPFGRQFGLRNLPVTDDVAARLLRLPFYCELTDSQMDEVASSLEAFYKKRGG